MEISVVLPNYNSRTLAKKNLAKLVQYLSDLFENFEIIVVDDGSKHSERLNTNELPTNVRLIQLDRNYGKGFAVKTGMLSAKGDVRVFTDIDLPYDLSAIYYSYKLIKSGEFHFVCGDRMLLQSQYLTKIPVIRRIASRVFSKIVSLIVVGGISDTQCGFKVFSASLAKIIFPLITINRFSFDVEIFYILLKYNILIKRIPVRLMNHIESSVSLFKHSLIMSLDIIRIPINWYVGRYRSVEMQQVFYRPYWEDNK